MPHHLRSSLLALAAFLACLVAPSAAHAGIWTPIASGTNEAILAIEYQGEDRFWFTTANGRIFKRAGGAFREVKGPSLTLDDIAFNGDVGLAVGQGGEVWRSTDRGDTWTKITGIPVRDSTCRESAPLEAVTAVRFATPTRVYVFGNGFGQIARSDDAGATWQDANVTTNSRGETDCTIRQVISDAFLPSADVGYFMSESFGQTFLSTDNLRTVTVQGDGPNGFENVHRVAGDPLNQNRQWALTPESGNGSYFQRTESGWRSETGWDVVGREEMAAGFDVAYAGGTVLAAGDSGMILNSADGIEFHFARADGALANRGWRSVALASGTQGAVGGLGGALVVTDSANSVPPPPPPDDFTDPTGTIAGPAQVAAGTPAAFQVSAADNPGGRGVDPSSFSWSAIGQPPAAGPSATFTFSEPGIETVRVSFRDGAGNTGSASRTVTVTKAAATLPAASKPPVKIRRSGGKIKVTVKGRLKIPAGIDRATGCKGNVIATIKKGRRLISARVIKLSKACGFNKTIKLSRSKVGRAKKLGITLRLEGNEIIGTTRKSYKLKVPRR